MERRIGDKHIAAGKYNEVPYIALVDFEEDKTFRLEGHEEIQALCEVLAGLEEEKPASRFYPGAKARVIADTDNHGFEIGTVVTVVAPFGFPRVWRVEDDGNHRRLVRESDLELLDDDAGGVSD